MFLFLNPKCLLNFLPDSSPSPPTEASRPTSGVEQAAGGGDGPNVAALLSETADSGETRESSRSVRSWGRGGSRRASGGEEGSSGREAARETREAPRSTKFVISRASGGEEDSGEDDARDLMRSIEMGGPEGEGSRESRNSE